MLVKLDMLGHFRDILRDEERAANVFIWGTCAVGAAAFVAALVAMAVLR